MLSLAIFFLIIAIVAALLAFLGIAGAEFTELFVLIFIVAFLTAFMLWRQSPRK